MPAVNKKALEKFEGFFALLGAAVTYACFGVWIKVLDETFGRYTQIFARSFIAIIVLLILLWAGHESLRIKRTDYKRAGLFAIGFPMIIIFFTLAVLHGKTTNAVMLLYAGSLLSAFLIGTFYFKESVTRQKVVAILLVLIGLLLFTRPWQGFVLSSGLIFGLLAGFSDGYTNSLRKLVQDLPRNTILFYQYSLQTIVSLLLIVFTRETIIKDLRLNGIVVALIFGILLVVLGRLLLFGFQRIDVNLATVVLSLELVFSVILSSIFLHERPQAHELIGAAFVLSGSIAAGLELNRQSKKAG